ncbi:VVA0879 family protein [Ottowia sp.]|uniref:VVA0879 family protein n=1 Tax=Ottowia sp. TaxID=1898956 RepID=UPI0025E0D4A4|nr:VVA0879 family protein [Ottowia sp.]MBK6616387.1 hypothetical protein [Ottowia sp.]
MQLPVEGEHERIKQASEDMKVVDRTCMAYTTRSISHAEWLAEAERLFGPNPLKWRFVCPSCGHVASVEDWKSAGASEGEVAFSCVGRHSTEEHKAAKAVFGRQGGPCNYAGGGLFKLNPVAVDFGDNEGPRMTFEFAPAPTEPEGAAIVTGGQAVEANEGDGRAGS